MTKKDLFVFYVQDEHNNDRIIRLDADKMQIEIICPAWAYKILNATPLRIKHLFATRNEKPPRWLLRKAYKTLEQRRRSEG